MTNLATQFDKRRDGMAILIQAAPGQGVGHISRRIETGDTVRLFLNQRAILAEVTGLSEGGFTGCISSKDTHLPVRPGQAVVFQEINVDAVFKRNSCVQAECASEQISAEIRPQLEQPNAAE